MHLKKVIVDMPKSEQKAVTVGSNVGAVQPEISDQNRELLRTSDHNIVGGITHMQESPKLNLLSNKTPEASLRESIGAIYEKSRTYWDSTVKKGDINDQKEQDLAALKTLAYIKLGEEIMKQIDLMGCLGKNGTETQLTKIRDGELYAFEKEGQLHITCNKADIDKNKGISLNDAVGRVERGGIDKVKWHLPKVYAIKLEKSPKEDLKVLITDNEDLFNNCKKFIESGAEDAASKVLITYEKDKKNKEKQFFDDNLKQEIKRGEIKGLQLVSGEKSGVDLSDVLTKGTPTGSSKKESSWKKIESRQAGSDETGYELETSKIKVSMDMEEKRLRVIS
jgi:hypothetical protein